MLPLLPLLMCPLRLDLESLEVATCTPTPRISHYVQGDDSDESGTQARRALALFALHPPLTAASSRRSSWRRTLEFTLTRRRTSTFKSSVASQTLSRNSLICTHGLLVVINLTPYTLCMIVAEIDKRSAFT